MAQIDPAEIEVVKEGPRFKDKADELAFMNEPVEVIVHSSTDPRADKIIELWVNGRSQFFLRNQPQTVKRMFVERLARSRTTAFSQEYYKDGNGNDAIRNVPHTALRYPFSVTKDTARGAAWLEKVLNEA